MNPHDDDLTSELREALRALPRERDPGALLEERTVRALRERGLLVARSGRAGVRRIPAAWLGGAVAAGLALFASGIALGQWMGTRHTAEVVEVVRAQDARQAALQVQQTGTAYVQALARMAEVDSAGAPSAEGREVAVRLLRAAADEMVRIAPDDPVASGILAGFQRADTAAARQAQRTVWF